MALPWDSFFGGDIRGGTPAILVGQHYLAFFHTVAGSLEDVRTYYMGAMRLCPYYPFNIHSISKHPIYDPRWYRGPWVSTNKYPIDYVVFPTGACSIITVAAVAAF